MYGVNFPNTNMGSSTFPTTQFSSLQVRLGISSNKSELQSEAQPLLNEIGYAAKYFRENLPSLPIVGPFLEKLLSLLSESQEIEPTTSLHVKTSQKPLPQKKSWLTWLDQFTTPPFFAEAIKHTSGSKLNGMTTEELEQYFTDGLNIPRELKSLVKKIDKKYKKSFPRDCEESLHFDGYHAPNCMHGYRDLWNSVMGKNAVVLRDFDELISNILRILFITDYVSDILYAGELEGNYEPKIEPEVIRDLQQRNLQKLLINKKWFLSDNLFAGTEITKKFIVFFINDLGKIINKLMESDIDSAEALQDTILNFFQKELHIPKETTQKIMDS